MGNVLISSFWTLRTLPSFHLTYLLHPIGTALNKFATSAIHTYNNRENSLFYHFSLSQSINNHPHPLLCFHNIISKDIRNRELHAIENLLELTSPSKCVQVTRAASSCKSVIDQSWDKKWMMITSIQLNKIIKMHN